MLDLDEMDLYRVDLIVVVHAADAAGLRLVYQIVGYSGGRDGAEVFSDDIEVELEDHSEQLTDEALLEFAGQSLRDAGIILVDPVWTTEFGGYEHHTRFGEDDWIFTPNCKSCLVPMEPASRGQTIVWECPECGLIKL